MFGLVACSSGPGSLQEEESVGTVRSAVQDNNTGAAYNSDCYWTYHVPLPPPWNATTTTNGTWTNKGPYTDTFTGDFNGTIYSWTTSDPQAPGVCVVNAHSSQAFDIICQGTGGNACFWEGPNVRTPPASGTPSVSTGSGCSSCHAGENVFLTHYSLPGQPQHATNLNGTTGWMPNWYQPVIDQWSGQNPDPGTTQVSTFRTSTSNCLGCHAGAPGGRFPQLSNGSGFCTTAFEAVIDRPSVGNGTIGGMPPNFSNGSPNDCTPGVSCAKQTDPFVQDMMTACGLTPPNWVSSTGAVPAYRGTLAGGGTGSNQSIYAIGTNFQIFQWTGSYWFGTDGGVDGNDHPTISVGGNGNVWTFINSALSAFVAPPRSCIPNNGTCHWQQIRIGDRVSQVAAGDGLHPFFIDTSGYVIYHFNGSSFVQEVAGSWQGRTTGGKLVQIAAGTDGDAWAVDSHGVVIHREGSSWVQRQPSLGGAANVNAIAVGDANHVWASTSSPLGIFNFFPGTTPVWQHHCPLAVPGGGNACNTTNSRFVAIGVSPAPDFDAWAINSAGQIYRVDNNRVVNRNNAVDDFSLFNTPSTTQFAQVSSGGGWAMTATSTGALYLYSQ